MNNSPYARTVIPVDGGSLTVGQWGPADAPALICLHGVTGTHMDWAPTAGVLTPEFRVIAPDLRGRGASSDITGPWGMAAHADDVVAVLDAEGIERGVLVGHSMGGFVAIMAANRHPDRVGGLVLVDGGLPAVEANEGGDALTRVVLDAARARLDQAFSSSAEYIATVRATLPPGAEFDEIDARIAEYDLVPADAGGWRVAGSYEAIVADSAHITGDGSADAAAALAHPALLLRAPRGLPPRSDGLYSSTEVIQWTERVPSLSARDVPGVDHGSIMRTAHGLAAIRAAAREMVALAD